MAKSYRVKLTQLDGMDIFSIYRFDTRENAQWYVDYLYRGDKSAAEIHECDDPPNVTVINDTLKWRLR